MSFRRETSDLELLSRPATRHEIAEPAPRRVTHDAPFITSFRRSNPMDAGSPGRASSASSAPSSAHSTGQPEVILVKSGFKQVATRVAEIVHIKAARNYVRIHLEGGQVLKSRIPIDRLGLHLGRQRFLRIHRGCLVNVDRIRGVTPLLGGRLLLALSDGSTVTVARDRRRSILAELGAATSPR
jgi:DNA-binding LytR/AlgR family response regulator